MRLEVLTLTVMVALSCGGGAASAQEGSEGAEFFVRDVYGLYRHDRPSSIDETRLDAVWSSRMAALIRRSGELANGELSFLDADPICGCQDLQSLMVQRVQIFCDGQRPDVVRMARVEFTNAGEAATVLLALTGSPIDGWRIDDVVDHQGMRSLFEVLAAANAGEATSHTTPRVKSGGGTIARALVRAAIVKPAQIGQGRGVTPCPKPTGRRDQWAFDGSRFALGAAGMSAV